jgi:hypothetical protein
MGFTVDIAETVKGLSAVGLYKTIRGHYTAGKRTYSETDEKGKTTEKAEYYSSYTLWTYASKSDYDNGVQPLDTRKHLSVVLSVAEYDGNTAAAIYTSLQSAYNPGDITVV